MRQVTLSELGQIAANSREDLWAAAHSAGLENPLLILHWSAGHYGQFFDDYHVQVDEGGEIYLTTEDLSEVLAHTWHLNRGTVGISLCCACFATTSDLGDEPPTEAQIETMAQVIAVLSSNLWLTCDRPDIVMTHGEAGDDSDLYDDEDLYGPQNDCERWDLQYLGTDESPYYTDDYSDPHTGGNVLRHKAAEYQKKWNREGRTV